MSKRTYVSPTSSHTLVVLEEGLCTTSAADSTISSNNSEVMVDDYEKVGDTEGFNDITFE